MSGRCPLCHCRQNQLRGVAYVRVSVCVLLVSVYYQSSLPAVITCPFRVRPTCCCVVVVSFFHFYLRSDILNGKFSSYPGFVSRSGAFRNKSGRPEKDIRNESTAMAAMTVERYCSTGVSGQHTRLSPRFRLTAREPEQAP